MVVVIAKTYRPSYKKWILLFGGFVILSIFMIATVIMSQNRQNLLSRADITQSQLFVATSTRSVSVGEDIIVNVYLNPKGNPVSRVDAVIKFDPAFVQVTDITPSWDKGFPTFRPIDEISRSFSWQKAVSQETGEIRFSALTYNSWTHQQVTPVSEDKVLQLAVIKLRSTAPGQSRLSLYQTSLSDNNDSNIIMYTDAGPVDVLKPPFSEFLITASGQ